jgi:hypothetical protein
VSPSFKIDARASLGVSVDGELGVQLGPVVPFGVSWVVTPFGETPRWAAGGGARIQFTRGMELAASGGRGDAARSWDLPLVAEGGRRAWWNLELRIHR